MEPILFEEVSLLSKFRKRLKKKRFSESKLIKKLIDECIYLIDGFLIDIDKIKNVKPGIAFVELYIKSLFKPIFSNHTNLKSLYNDISFLNSIKNSLSLISLCTISTNVLTSHDVLPEELCRYINVGKELKESKEVVQIKKELQDLKIEGSTSIYLAIIGPSYMGKTQTAFTLSNSMNLIYVNFVALHVDVAQLIYCPFSSIAEIFYTCISKDIDIIRLEQGDNEFKSLSILRLNAPLHSLGLIFTIFEFKNEMNQNSQKTVEDWFKFLINLNSIVFPKLTMKQFYERIREGTLI